jgi:hypothetical protein
MINKINIFKELKKVTNKLKEKNNSPNFFRKNRNNFPIYINLQIYNFN